MKPPLVRLGSTAILAAALVITGCQGSRGSAGPQGAAGNTGTTGTPGGTTGLSTGLVVNITSAAVTADRHPYALFTIADSAKNPQAATGISFNWTLAYLGTDAVSNLGAYQSYILQSVTGNAPGGRAGTTQQPTSEAGSKGTLTDLGGGQFQYTFSLALPATYTATATHRIGMWASRPLPGTGTGANNPAQNDIVNAVFDFVPAGGTPQTRDLTATQNCNTCHGILQVHGGFRRDYRLCMTCHTTQLVDPDTSDTNDPSKLNPLDLGTLVHRIHRGNELPTVQNALAAANLTADPAALAWEYHVIGFRNGDNVYGNVAANPIAKDVSGNPSFKADANGTAGASTANAFQKTYVAGGIGYPQDLRNCTTCHQPVKDSSGKVTAGAQADQWQTAVSRRTCASCHDDIWFGAPAGLPKFHKVHGSSTDPTQGLPQANDAGCATCHPKTQATGTYSLAVADAHQDPQVAVGVANPFTVKIVSATGVKGAAATVKFQILDKNGAPIAPATSLNNLFYDPVANPNGLSSLNVVLSGPTTDYQYLQGLGQGTSQGTPAPAVNAATRSPDLRGSTGNPAVAAPFPAGMAYDAASGTYTYTFQGTKVVPATASGTWAASIEGRRSRTVTHPSSLGSESFTEGFLNPVAYFSVDGSPVAPRRTVALQAQCNACHVRLALHGGQRRNVEECVMCHAPDASDWIQRPLSAANTTDGLLKRSINLKPLIHAIHTGENLDLSQPFTVYGNGRSVNYFGEVRFPGTRANCAVCHQPGTFTLDAIPATALPTQFQQIAPGTIGTVGPMASACISCHDHADTVAHVTANSVNFNTATPLTTPSAESCTVCHGEAGEFSVTSLHAPFANGFRQ